MNRQILRISILILLQWISNCVQYYGKITYYEFKDFQYTSCGYRLNEHRKIAALSSKIMQKAMEDSGETNNNKNPLCGREIKIQSDRRVVTAIIGDTCPGIECPLSHVDLTEDLFRELGCVGRCYGTWIFTEYKKNQTQLMEYFGIRLPSQEYQS